MEDVLRPYEKAELTNEDWQYTQEYYQFGRGFLAKNQSVAKLQMKAIALSNWRTRNPLPASQLTTIINDFSQNHLDEKALIGLNAGTIYENALFDHPKTEKTEAVKHATWWNPTIKPFLALFGSTGTGKTYAGIASMARNMARNKQKGLFLTHHDFSSAIGIGKYDRQEEIKKAKWLMLDDLKIQGEGTVTSAFKTFFDEVVDYRYRFRLPTVITSNCSVDEFKTTYGERVASRMKNNSHLLLAVGEDKRRKDES